MLEAKLDYNWYITWKQIQYKHYALLDYLKNSYDPEELWSSVPLE